MLQCVLAHMQRQQADCVKLRESASGGGCAASAVWQQLLAVHWRPVVHAAVCVWGMLATSGNNNSMHFMAEPVEGCCEVSSCVLLPRPVVVRLWHVHGVCFSQHCSTRGAVARARACDSAWLVAATHSACTGSMHWVTGLSSVVAAYNRRRPAIAAALGWHHPYAASSAGPA